MIRFKLPAFSMLTAVSALTLLPLVSGCGGSGDDNDDEPARVVDLFFEESTIRRGESARLLVDFSFAANAVGDEDRNVIIKLALPAGVIYEPGSAEVDTIGGGDDVNPERTENCVSGGTIVTFDLDESDLTAVDDPAGDADGTLKLSIVGVDAGTVTVEGRAGYDVVAGSCADGVVPQASVILVVTP